MFAFAYPIQQQTEPSSSFRIEVASQETTELLIIEDFAGKSDVDLSVKQGDWVESTSISVNGWLWVKHDKTEGFIPTKIAIMATDL